MLAMNKLSTKQDSNNKDSRRLDHSKSLVLINKFGVFFMIIVLAILGMIISPSFLTGKNILNILSAVALIGIVTSGLIFVLYCGQFGDMSIPMTMALSGIICIEFMRFGLVWGIIAALCVGLVVGIINGLVIGELRVNAIVWTMAMNFILEGSIRWFYAGTQLYPDTSTPEVYKTGFFLPLMRKLNPDIVNTDMTPYADKFNALATTYFHGIPLMLIVMFIMMIISHIILKHTSFGNQLKIVGSNYNVGKMSGIKATRTAMSAFILSSLCASVAGIFITSMNRVGSYQVGIGYDFQAVTAIILGGVSLAGGRGSMIGVFGGVFTIGLVGNILTLLGVGTFEQKMVTGMIFIIVVAVNSRSLRKLGRDDA